MLPFSAKIAVAGGCFTALSTAALRCRFNSATALAISLQMRVPLVLTGLLLPFSVTPLWVALLVLPAMILLVSKAALRRHFNSAITLVHSLQLSEAAALTGLLLLFFVTPLWAALFVLSTVTLLLSAAALRRRFRFATALMLSLQLRVAAVLAGLLLLFSVTLLCPGGPVCGISDAVCGVCPAPIDGPSSALRARRAVAVRGCGYYS
jgi:hypothetical protein